MTMLRWPLWRNSRHWQRLLEDLRSDVRLASGIVVASICLRLFGFATPLIVVLLADRVVPSKAYSLLHWLMIAAVVVGVVQCAVTLSRSWLLALMQKKLDERMTARLVQHILQVPLSFFAARPTGDVISRLHSNTLVRDLLSGQYLGLVLDALLVVVYFGAILFFAPPLALLVGGIAALHVRIMVGTIRASKHHVDAEVSAQASAHSYLTEVVRGIATVKASAAEDEVFRRWRELFDIHILASHARARVGSVADSANSAVYWFAGPMLLVIGATFTLRQDITLGELLALSALGAAAIAPLGTLVQSVQYVRLAETHLTRVEDVLSYPVERPSSVARRDYHLSGAVSLSGVNFAYGADRPKALSNVNLDIASGELVAVVGRSGSGKSTLAHLLLGLYPPSSGTIEFDGVNSNDIDTRCLRLQLAAVWQDVFIFGDTIANNVAFGNGNPPFEAIVKAGDLAALSDVVSELAGGWELRLQEGGRNLSSGQRQRVAIARALVRRPALLILDEATSHVDSITERRILESVGRLSTTRVVITHRLATIAGADKIVVMEKGCVVGVGHHNELRSSCREYADMLTAQVVAT